jgi:signal transduction histidine kinase
MRPRPQRLLDYREYPILYVDDEKENLRIFELAFKREYAVLTAESGDEGLRILHDKPVALVLSDHRMPTMTGVQFLSRVREVDAKTVRILVTAYGDAETLGSAVNDGSIYRYVPKPWSPDEMRVTLRRAIEVYALDRERDELLRELTILNRVSHSINQELALDPLLELLLTAVTRELEFDGASLFFFEAKGERMRHARGATSGEHDVATSLDLSLRRSQAPEMFARLLAGESQRLEIGELSRLEPALQRWLTELAADEILLIPLVGKSEVIGALAVDNRRGGRSFDASDHTMLEGFTTQAAIAIENARLVDELKQSRAEVMRADRLGRLGTLAAGLAHEINNPLVAIRTFLTLAPAKRTVDDGEFWGSYHALACREVDRIGGLVATMSRLARGSQAGAPREHCDVAELTRETSMLLEREAMRARVKLVIEAASETPKLVASRDQIHQVLLNLVLNAIQATPPNGTVTVTTGAEETPEGTNVVIEVADTGSGIPAEDLERIFDPFFTTKDPDQGTGLGLMICHRIVTDHSGTIDVQSRTGEGARFRVRLPAGA